LSNYNGVIRLFCLVLPDAVNAVFSMENLSHKC